MVGETEPQGVAQQYSTYIDELREFFLSRKIRFGAPADLNAFAEQVSEAGPFEEEMGSMVRTILYQEEHLGRNKLLELVIVAVGGPEALSSAPEWQGAVRAIFLFLNAAVRQTRVSFVPEEEEEESSAPLAPPPMSQVAAEVMWQQPDPVPPSSMPGRSLPPSDVPSSNVPSSDVPLSGVPPQRPTRPAQDNEVLYRAMSLSAEETPRQGSVPEAAAPVQAQERIASRVPWWAIPAAGLGLAAVAAGVYVGRPYLHRAHSEIAAVTGGLGAAEATASCEPPMAAGVTRSGLEERSLWAHNLLEQRLYEVALPELREIARLDPGYPGVKLDESDALLNLKHPEEARDAVDAQIATSECLAKLPPASLDAYCKAQYSSAAVSGCRPQLTHIRQAAELQAALVHLELGHQVQPDAAAAAAMAELTGESEAPAKPTHARAAPPPKRKRP